MGFKTFQGVAVGNGVLHGPQKFSGSFIGDSPGISEAFQRSFRELQKSFRGMRLRTRHLVLGISGWVAEVSEEFRDFQGASSFFYLFKELQGILLFLGGFREISLRFRVFRRNAEISE